jgi:8-oxo-dGTP diphosphatase
MHIRLIAYLAKFVSGEIKLIDHDEYYWIKHDQLKDFIFATADIKFVNMLLG